MADFQRLHIKVKNELNELFEVGDTVAARPGDSYVAEWYGSTGPFIIQALYRCRDTNRVIATFHSDDFSAEPCCNINRLTKHAKMSLNSKEDMDALYG